ncbi:hypothetical protein [Thalassiella azotivora]
MRIDDADQLRGLLHGTQAPEADPAIVREALRAGRRRRTVRRAAWAGSVTVAAAAVLTGGLLVLPWQDAPPAAPGPSVTQEPAPEPSPSEPGEEPTAGPTGPPGADGVTVVAAAQDAVVVGALPPGGADLEATRELAPPFTPATAGDVAVTGGADPVACVVWVRGPGAESLDAERRLTCYAPGSVEGVDVPAAGTDPATVALRPDGTQVAWADDAYEGNTTLTVAPLDGVVVGPGRARLQDPSRPAGSPADDEAAFTGTSVTDLAFAGDTGDLVVTLAAQSDDEGSGLLMVPAGAGDGWWGPDDVLTASVAVADGRLERLRGAASAGEQDAVAVLAARAGESGPGARGVRVDLRDGRVLETLVTPAEGRTVRSVVRGRDVLLYVTERTGGGDPVVRLRWADEDRGVPLTGLPGGVQRVAVSP